MTTESTYSVAEISCDHCRGGVSDIVRGDQVLCRDVPCDYCRDGVEAYAIMFNGEIDLVVVELRARAFARADADELAAALNLINDAAMAAYVAAHYERHGELPAVVT
jgi:hypothetical protein